MHSRITTECTTSAMLRKYYPTTSIPTSVPTLLTASLTTITTCKTTYGTVEEF